MSQFRRYFRPSFRDKVRTRLTSRSGAKLGRGAVVQSGARVERFPTGLTIDADSIVKPHARICPCNPEARIHIGARTTVGFYDFIYSSERIDIGDDCLIAPFVYIVDSNHGMRRGQKIALQPNQTEPISIGDDVWIGAQSVILSGARIADGCVIAAGTVLNASTRPYEVWGGIPGRKLADRT